MGKWQLQALKMSRSGIGHDKLNFPLQHMEDNFFNIPLNTFFVNISNFTRGKIEKLMETLNHIFPILPFFAH